jgi:energy-converting hydrogenase Eha subunit B
MSTPNPVPSSTASANTLATAAPTMGAVLGSVLGGYVATKLPGGTDPALTYTVASSITGFVTALFHWMGTKLGIAALG